MIDTYTIFLIAIFALVGGFILIVGGVSIWAAQLPQPVQRDRPAKGVRAEAQPHKGVPSA